MALNISGRLGKICVGDNCPVRIVGIINLSPESFYGESVARGPGGAIEMAGRMIEEGADVLDIGAMSTAPYLEASISPEEEQSRLVPAIRDVCKNYDVPVSADTQRHEVAEEAVAAGATIINDISGGRDPALYVVAAKYGASLILLPSDVGPVADPLDSTLESLGKNLKHASDAGVDISGTLVDPGIGFIRKSGFEWYDRDARIIANLERLRLLGRPIFIGVSRKSFIGKITGAAEPSERLYGSLAATALSVLKGIHAVRTHDVMETIQAVRLAEYVKRKL